VALQTAATAQATIPMNRNAFLPGTGLQPAVSLSGPGIASLGVGHPCAFGTAFASTILAAVLTHIGGGSQPAGSNDGGNSAALAAR